MKQSDIGGARGIPSVVLGPGYGGTHVLIEISSNAAAAWFVKHMNAQEPADASAR